MARVTLDRVGPVPYSAGRRMDLDITSW